MERQTDMINFFDNLRFWGSKRNSFLAGIRFYQFMNHASFLLANMTLPVYFRLTGDKYRLEPSPKTSGRVIVSLTSFPARIGNVHLVIESLLRQTRKPDKIILCLTKSQIPEIGKLPSRLLELQKRGLEIVLCDAAIRSHTKYHHAFRHYPEDNVITVDDDIIYRTDLIENLLAWHVRFPHSIIANWVKKIRNCDDMHSYYCQWPEADGRDAGIEAADDMIFGVGGVLYPPHCMYKDCLDIDLIKSLCLTADDVWLSCMGILAGTTFVFTGYKQGHLPVRIRNNVTLLAQNRTANQIQVDRVNDYYAERLGIRPLCRHGK